MVMLGVDIQKHIECHKLLIKNNKLKQQNTGKDFILTRCNYLDAAAQAPITQMQLFHLLHIQFKMRIGDKQVTTIRQQLLRSMLFWKMCSLILMDTERNFYHLLCKSQQYNKPLLEVLRNNTQTTFYRYGRCFRSYIPCQFSIWATKIFN